MTDTEAITVRIPPALKREAQKALSKLGLTPEEAIADFFQHIVEEYEAGGDAWLEIPHVTCCLAFGGGPNAESLSAMKEIDEGGGIRHNNIAELRAYLESDTEEDVQSE